MDYFRRRSHYPQPHTLRPLFLELYQDNPALREHMIAQEHFRLKFDAKYQRSKNPKRLPSPKN
jgi:hypothetical protein